MTLVADFNSSVSVPFQRMRALLLEQGGGLQEGVVGLGDLKVSQRGAGANLSADVAVGAAWVQLDTGTRNGVGHVYSDAIFNAGPFTAGNGTNPRIDQAILRWNDTSIPTGAGNVPTIEVLTGTATSGATLDNRLGATALPNDCVRLADVLMPISAASVTTANIRDRRPWARGACVFGVRSTSVALPGVVSPGSELDTTNWKFRVECSGVPVRLSLGPAAFTVLAGNVATVRFWMDGADLANSQGIQSNTNNTAVNLLEDGSFSVVFTPAAGSHLMSVAGQYQSGGATPTIGPATFTVEELIRPNASNT